MQNAFLHSLTRTEKRVLRASSIRTTALSAITALTLLLSTSQTTQAGSPVDTALWISNTDGSWFAPENWVDGNAPQAGTDAQFGDGGFQNPVDVVDIDNGGKNVFQPDDALIVRDKVMFLDSAVLIEGTSPADDGLVFDTMLLNGAGGLPVLFHVPVTATTMESTRHGAVFNHIINTKQIKATSGHQDKWEIKAGAVEPILHVLLDENRGPDGGNLESFFSIDSSLGINFLEHVWNELRIEADAVVEIDFYHYSDYTGLPENNNINPIQLDGTLSVEQFFIQDMATTDVSELVPGTYGRVGHPTADFELPFISGDGIMIIIGDLFFGNGFEIGSN